MEDTVARRGTILYISHYFPPEVNAPANRVYEMARAWVQRGRRVKVLTGFPNHPNGVIPQRYRGKIYMRETVDGIEVHRCWLYAAANRGFVRRIANYLSFMLSAILVGVFKVGRAECVIATSPQIFVAVAGWIVSLAKRAPVVFEVRDLWPAEIVAVGAIRNRLIIKSLEKLEMFLYRRAKRIIALAQGTIEILTLRGVPSEKFVLIPNGVDFKRFNRGRRQNYIRDRLNLDGDFLVSYIGTVGLAHKLDVLLEAARLLKNTPRLKFLIVGDGAEKDRLRRRQLELGLDNVLMLEQQPQDDIASYYHTSDCCLVHLKHAPLFEKNIPSKIFEIMACEKPILLGTRGESKRLVSRAGCGVYFEPENPRDLAAGIRRLKTSSQWRKRLGRSGYDFVRRHYSREDLADRYLSALNAVMGLKPDTVKQRKIESIDPPVRAPRRSMPRRNRNRQPIHLNERTPRRKPRTAAVI